MDPERYVIGDVIAGRYEVLAVHKGGMGIVYATLDAKTGLPRALKTVQARFASDLAVLDLFEDEAAIWVRLEKHPSIVRAYSVQKIEGLPYVIAEYVRGQPGMGTDLRSWLGHPSLTPRLSIALAMQIAEAMQHAINKVPGLVHRDLKPANVLVDGRARAMVTDFGLVYATDADAGTPAYMAPEQWRRGKLDQRTDIYAYGCILYEMFSGRRVFPAATLEEFAAAHMTLTPPQLRSIRPNLPAGLDEFVFCCLAKDPACRPRSWGDVVRECACWVERLTGNPPEVGMTGDELTVDELVTAGNSLLRLQKHGEALAICERGIGIRPGDYRLWDLKGVALQRLGRLLEGLAAHERAAALNPNDPVPWNNAAIALTALGRHGEALHAYDRALRTDPSYSSAATNKCWLLLGMGRIEEAVLVCDRVLAVDPECSEAWNNRGAALDRMELHTAALLSYDRAVAIAPWYATAWYNKGLIHHRLNEPAAALFAYENALRSDPRYKEAWNNKGHVLADFGRYDEALAAYDSALMIDAHYAKAWYSKGQLLQRMGRLEQALAAYDQVLAVEPTHKAAWANKRELQRELQRLGQE